MTKYTNFTVIIFSKDLVTFFLVFTVPFPTCQKQSLSRLKTHHAAEVWRPISMQGSFLQTTQTARSLEANWVIGVLKTVLRTIHSGVPSKPNLLLKRHLCNLKTNTVFSRTSHYQLIIAEDICLLICDTM